MLTPDEDAYGRLLYDYHCGKDAHELDEREDGWIGRGPVDHYFAELPDWPEWQRDAMEYVRGRVLDIGAGAGRCSLYLQQRGHEVVATDNSPLAIETCRLRGVRRAEVVPITELGPDLGVFDTLLMLGNNFGLFGSARRARWLLRRFRGFTAPGARIIAESTDVCQTDGPVHLAYYEQNRQRGRLPGQLRIRVRYLTAVTPWFDYLLVSKQEMEDILVGTGWRLAHTCDSPGAQYVGIIERE